MTDPELTAAVELGCQRAYEEIGIAGLDLKKLPTPLSADKYGLYIWGRDGIMIADFGVLRMRGWGYLTGGASLRLPEDCAIEVQKAWQAEIVKRCNSFGKLLEVCEEVECGLQFFVETRGDVDGQLQDLLVRLADVSEKARGTR